MCPNCVWVNSDAKDPTTLPIGCSVHSQFVGFLVLPKVCIEACLQEKGRFGNIVHGRLEVVVKILFIHLFCYKKRSRMMVLFSRGCLINWECKIPPL